MRTTVAINDKLAAEAKRLAAERNTTLSEIINEALRERLARSTIPRATEVFRMPVFGVAADQVDSTPVELSRIDEDEELRPYTP